MLSSTSQRSQRRGAVAAEFAIIAPVVVFFILGICELGQALSGATRVASAIREGGRLASMEFEGKLEPNQTPNQKVTQDILNFLAATGVSPSNVQVSIVHAEGDAAGTTFDLAAPENYLKLFRIDVVVPYDNVSANPIKLMDGYNLTASTVFRRGRTPVPSN